MLAYLLRRFAASLAVLALVSLGTFMMVHLVPGDPVRAMLGEGGQTTAEDIEQMRRQLGLDRPLPVQYLDYVTRAVRGDFGQSIRTDRPVITEIRAQLPATIQLAAAAFVVATVVGIGLGALAATHHNSWLDNVGMMVALLGVSVPSFWLGLLLIFIFSLRLGWLPAAGMGGISHLILPALTLGLWAAGIIARLTRSSLLEVLRQDYMVTARSKGMSERAVLVRHAFRNALVPIVTIVGLQIGTMLSGAIIVETVFARSGLGRLVMTAIVGKDFPMVQGIVLFSAVIYVAMNLLVDISYAVLDPRIRYA
jgi:ABC-type dipeptide/oligopeptide/nickel transport system permease component